MPCDKYMEIPSHERLRLEMPLRGNEKIDEGNILYSLRYNPKTKGIEYQIPPSEEWITGN